jgi:tetratricopeptide (TPR) repeat protein
LERPFERGNQVKRETIITAIVFLVVGFFIGYITEAEYNWNAPEKMAPTQAAAAPPETAVSAPQSVPGGGTPDAQLPPGHLPLEVAATIKQLEDQAAQNPKDPDPPLKLANLFYDQRQFDRAADWYQKALALDPKNVSARTDLGTAYFNLGRPKDALNAYQESLKIDPTHEPTMFNIIIVNMEGTHDLAAARAAWDKLHKRNPSYPGLNDLKKGLTATDGVASAASSMH